MCVDLGLDINPQQCAADIGYYINSSIHLKVIKKIL